jgi:branched-chain amino acid transport system ATP-binding protein
VLRLDDIHTYYGNLHALKGVTLQVNEGEIVCLLGSNGAGKSTTLMSICGVNRIKEGGIKFLGKDISRIPTDKIVNMGISQVPEGRRIFPALTIYENLLMGAYSRKDKKEVQQDLKGIYDHFPMLYDRRNQQGGTLSGGEQQILAIARGLMLRPKLMLFDEPSLGLAPKIIEQVFDIIKDINREGTAVLIVEQNANAALKLSHRGYVMESGKIVLEDTAANLLNNEQVKKAYLGIE